MTSMTRICLRHRRLVLLACGLALYMFRVRRGSTTFSRGWERWGQIIVLRRWMAGAFGLAIVIGLAIPALSMNTGQPLANSLGGTGQPARRLHTLEADGVPSAVVFPIQLLTHGGPAAAERAIAIAASTPGIYTVLAPATAQFRHGGDNLISVIPLNEGATSAGTATVARLRAPLARAPGEVRSAATPRRTSWRSRSCSGCRWATRCSSWPGYARNTTGPGQRRTPWSARSPAPGGKFGALIYPPQWRERLEAATSAWFFQHSQYDLAVMASILADSRFQPYLDQLSGQVGSAYAYLRDQLASPAVTVPPLGTPAGAADAYMREQLTWPPLAVPPLGAGCFALVDAAGLGLDDVSYARLLRDRYQELVVPVSWFPSGEQPTTPETRVRVALTRTDKVIGRLALALDASRSWSLAS